MFLIVHTNNCKTSFGTAHLVENGTRKSPIAQWI